MFQLNLLKFFVCPNESHTFHKTFIKCAGGIEYANSVWITN